MKRLVPTWHLLVARVILRLPVVPGLLELLGVVVVGQWSWKNLTTSDKRNALVTRIQSIRKEYLG